MTTTATKVMTTPNMAITIIAHDDDDGDGMTVKTVKIATTVMVTGRRSRSHGDHDYIRITITTTVSTTNGKTVLMTMATLINKEYLAGGRQPQTRKTKKKSRKRSKIPDTFSTRILLLLSDRIVLRSARWPWFTLSPASSTLS